MKIYMDHREPKEFEKFLAKNEIPYEIKQLPAADFAIGNIGIERKTQLDFLNSIIDKRILNQLINLKENFEVQLLIIEGKENIYELRNFHPNAIRGMLTAIALDFQIPILHTRNLNDTAALLISIYKRLERPKKVLGLINKRKPLTLKEQQEFLIESLPGVGPVLSKSLLTKFKSVKKVINAKESQLQKIDKIGPKKAKGIKKVIEENYFQSNL